MRFRLLFVFLLAVALTPQSVSAKKASTIDELAEMYSIKHCAECHKDKYEEWKTSSMGNSLADPRVLKGMRTFIRLAIDREEELERKALTICLNCHIPQIKDATPELVLHIGDLILTAVEDKDEAKREAAKKDLSKLNLNCLGCHNLKGTGFHSTPEEKVIYGPRDIEDSPHEGFGYKTVKSELFTVSEFCAQCHHCPPSVPWNECPTIFTSYVDEFVIKNGRNETCQDCHMEGKKLSHKFLGPNNLDFLKSSVSLTVNARPTRYIDIYENEKMPAVILQVTLKNHAGHEIPHG
ncbi:MAG: hypothetical protein C4538_11345 [Nitrospiraceae bacterium]|nr:MAG: hypothetical protein C4538_11345 [Nitrospiraceae bacterium]